MSASLAKPTLTFADALARDDELVELVDYAQALADEAQAASTRRSYLSATTMFATWCREKGVASLPAEPETLAVYLGVLEKNGRLVSTIVRHVAAVSDAHRRHGFDPPHPSLPTTKVLKGIRRRLKVRPRTQKDAVTDDDLIAMVRTCGVDLAGLRDRVLLTWGWNGAFRRGELVAVEVDDLHRSQEGIVVLVRDAKNDQEGKGTYKVISRALNPEACPVRAFDAWIAASGITRGPIFRGMLNGKIRRTPLYAGSVARIVKRIGERAGLDPVRIAAHSLRAGFITTADAKGCSIEAIMKQTNQKSERTTRGYVRHKAAFIKNAAVGLV